MNVTAWVKEHPYATGGIVLGVGVLVLVLKRGSGSSSGSLSSESTQLAALNAQTNLQNAQIAAQENQTNAQTSASEYQTEAGVAANEDTLAAQVAGEGIQGQVYNEQLQAGLTENAQNDALSSTALGDQYALATLGAKISTQGNRATVGTNIVAEALGQGNVASFNEGAAGESELQTLEQGSLLNNLVKTGGGVLGGLFG